MQKKWLLFLITGFLLITVNFILAATAKKTFQESYSLKYGSEISLANSNGVVEIRTWKQETIEIIAEIEVKAQSKHDAEDYLKHVKINIKQDINHIKITSDYPHKGGNSVIFDWFSGNRTPEVEIHYSLTVPQQSDLDIKNVNGAVKVEEIEGQINLKTTNGRIEGANIRGSVGAETANGTIELEVIELFEDESLSLKTINGTIVLYLPSNVRADVDASSVNGTIETDFPLTVSGKFVGRKVHGEINGGGGFIHLKAVNGSIHLLER